MSPASFNRNKEKLFGFYGYEHWWMGIPGTLQQVTTPTAAERGGDFSNSLTVGGALIPIIDPTTARPFPGMLCHPARSTRMAWRY